MQSMTILPPVIFATFLWWFSTGAIMAVYRRSLGFLRVYFAVTTVLMLVALGGVFLMRDATGTTDVYIAASCGVVIFGWHVMSYYLGFITGPRKAKALLSTHGTDAWSRFKAAVYFSLYHEVLVLLTAMLLLVMTWGSANQWSFWLYLTLWLMHTSAKVNVFLGVRNFHIDFLPWQMRPLGPLLSQGKSNALFPFSIVIATSVAIGLFYRVLLPDTPEAHIIGYLMIVTNLVLGILEHWLLVLPLPATLWGWGLRALPENRETHPSGEPPQHSSLPAGD